MPEILIFAVSLKVRDVPDDVLAAIDRAIPLPIVFEITRDDPTPTAVRMAAGYKRLGGKRRGGARPRPDAYFTIDWLHADTPRRPLPPALDLPSLYASLLGPLMPEAPRPGEQLSAAMARIEQRRKRARDVAALEKRLSAEPQLNRKIDLRRQLRDRTAASPNAERLTPRIARGQADHALA